MSTLLQEMAEGIGTIDQRKEVKRLVGKWTRTGLLEGLSESKAGVMARLLENQASALLTEASVTSDIIGFQNVAFPIVRRVFAGLIANELVSVQPMSLPSGLLFYLDYRWDSNKPGMNLDGFTNTQNQSLFGDLQVAGDQTSGLAGTGGFFNLGSSFSQREKITGTFQTTIASATAGEVTWDPDLCPPGLSSTQAIGAGYWTVTVVGGYTAIAADGAAAIDVNALKQVVLLGSASQAGNVPTGTMQRFGDTTVYRRHTVRDGNNMKFVVSSSQSHFILSGAANGALSYIVGSSLSGGTTGTLTLDSYESDMAGTDTAFPKIPELDFTIKSVAVTANPRKLKAKWTPELAQDLAAYQNLDAEVELTQVLSEAIALEIDREILGDLLANASGANFYWSRVPGRFMNKTTGAVNGQAGGPPSATFTGTVREWYETLIETIIDVANNIHRKTLRGAANFLVTSPDVATILEASVLYKPVLSMDPKETMFTVGTEKVGSLNNRFTVYKDPYFPRNKILVGYKGGSFLETGYVYAPYVPLIVTPTIYAPEDFTPRKGVMTRYAKKMVRSDFYGTVTVMDLNVI
jgi:hypothetical protein